MIMRVFPFAVIGALTVLSAFGAEIPRKAPEFVINLPKGGQTLLSQFRGKVVVCEFLYTTCPHCQHASQLMSKLQTEYGPRGLQSLGVAFNDMAQMLVADFVRDFQVNYPVGYSTREAVHGFLQSDPNHSLHVPQLVFIDRKGVIRHQSLTQNDVNTATEGFLRQMIETLLKEASAPAAAKKAVKKAS